jgi:UDP-glucose 4-epimerase
MSKILVIGGSGFMGSHVADELTKQGHDVTIYDMRPSPWLNANQKMIEGDILDLDKLNQSFEGMDYVYHFAGVADIGEASSDPLTTIQSNIMGCTLALEACVKQKVKRLFYASTVYVYSDRGSFYRASKQSAETIVEAYHEKFGLDYTILRYGSLYGERSQPWNGLKRYVSQAVREGRINYRGTGRERREYVYVKDAAKLSVKAMEEDYLNTSLTITGTQVLKSEELLTMIEEIIGKKIDVQYTQHNDPNTANDHYVMTPYRFTPKPGKKLVPPEFVDIGQGILCLVEEVYHEQNHQQV